MPGVAEVHVVVGDGALVECVGQRRVEGQRGTLAGVGDLRRGHDAESRRRYAAGRRSGRVACGRNAESSRFPTPVPPLEPSW